MTCWIISISLAVIVFTVMNALLMITVWFYQPRQTTSSVFLVPARSTEKYCNYCTSGLHKQYKKALIVEFEFVTSNKKCCNMRCWFDRVATAFCHKLECSVAHVSPREPILTSVSVVRLFRSWLSC